MIRFFLIRLCFFLWPKYMEDGNEHCELLVLKHWFIQKIFRINSHVPWPVHPTSKVICPNRIKRGTRTPGLANCCHIDGRNGIEIGRNVWIGPRVSIISMNHDPSDYRKYVNVQPVIIQDNCWLASNCIILPGVHLGPHTIVAAGAIVTKSFPEGNQILGGVPAKIIKKIGQYEGK